MNKKRRLFNVSIILMLFLGACNLPSNNPEDAEATAAAQTVEALLSATPLFTETASPTPLATITPIPSAAVTNTPAATATSNCNVAQFITDVTIPDGTVMTPGQSFTKKWRIKNIGSCAWNGYTLAFDSGDPMGAVSSKPIPAVNPGQEVDLEVDFTAPNTAGTYRSYWRIVTNNNVLVPVAGGYQGRSFYVDIKVQAPTATPTNTTTPFAVTGITYSIGTWSDAGHTNCPRITANITTNGAGTVNFKWKREDIQAGGATQTLNFASAGTQSVNYDWARGSVWAGQATWVGIYVESPNNQDFGKIDFSTACTSP